MAGTNLLLYAARTLVNLDNKREKLNNNSNCCKEDECCYVLAGVTICVPKVSDRIFLKETSIPKTALCP